MRLVPVVLAFGALLVLTANAGAQPYPVEDSVIHDPYPITGAAPEGGTPDAGLVVYDTTHDPYDTDPDIDGYDAQTDVYYDNVAAQGYDDGYDPQAYTQFQSALDPYGTWIDDASYGRVWQPSVSVVGASFFPYASGGRWMLTEYGWTWVSDWDWGWAPFHYGRWTMVGSYGWCWIPGTVWGPAWVSWRSGGGYVGWAPMPPPGVTIGPPSGVRSPWRFTLAGGLAGRNLSFLPHRAIPSIFAKTSVVSNLRSVSIGTSTVRVNAGPTGLLHGAGVGASTPVLLKNVAPAALPQSTISPRSGVPLASRPWVQAGVGRIGVTRAPTAWTPPIQRPTSIPIGPQYGPRPMYTVPPHTYNPGATAPRPGFYVTPSQPVQPARPYYAPTPGPTYQAPHYQQQPAYAPPPRPYYQAPAPSYSAPARSYSPPPSFSTPSYNRGYSAPSPSWGGGSGAGRSYSAPSPAPSYSRPSYSAPSQPVGPSMGGARGGIRR